MIHSEGRILTSHTGSLPRPAELTRLYVRRASGVESSDDELARARRSALRDVIVRQLAAGIDVGNDGEQQRESFFLYLRHRLTGLGGSWDRPTLADVERYPEYKRMREADVSSRVAVSNADVVPRAIGPVTYRDPQAIEDDCEQFAAALREQPSGFVEAFMSAPSPGILATAIRDEHYGSLDAYLAALGDAVRIEYQAIVDQGFLLQIDCPDIALERHGLFQDRPLAVFLEFVEAVVETINRALRGIPRDRVRLHVCWGNVDSPHDCDVPLEEILMLVRRAAVGGFVLPFANPRHAHEYRLLGRLLDDDQLVVAGVIDPLTNVIEHPEVVAERIERVAAVLGDPRRVIAGTDCGFETSAGMGRVVGDVAWAKLGSLSDGARIASERLFGRSAAVGTG